jgi:hypothetical protein
MTRRALGKAFGVVGSIAGMGYCTMSGYRGVNRKDTVTSVDAPPSCIDFISEQQGYGIPAREICSDMLRDMKRIASTTQGVEGPSSFGSKPMSMKDDFLLKTGNTPSGYKTAGAITGPFGAEHLFDGAGTDDSLRILFGRHGTFLSGLRGRLNPGDKFVTFHAGSLNSFHETGSSTNVIKNIVDGLDDAEMGSTVKAETGVTDYAYGWYANRLNSGRRGYDLSLVTGFAMNTILKMQYPDTITVNVNHSWGGPSTIQSYAFMMATYEAKAGVDLPKGLPRPIDELICVDPRSATGPTAAKALASQIRFLRSRGVKISVIKDSSKTNGFGLVNFASSLDYVVAGSGETGVVVDELITKKVGHEIKLHYDEIQSLLAED